MVHTKCGKESNSLVTLLIFQLSLRMFKTKLYMHIWNSLAEFSLAIVTFTIILY